jgi:hypothetical protein
MPVDVETVSMRLKQLNNELLDVNKEIEDYCKELGISTPF